MVNDVPAFKYFKEGQIITPITINEFINKSGKQTITYKLYPLTKRTGGDGFNTLLDWTSIKIELFSVTRQILPVMPLRVKKKY